VEDHTLRHAALAALAAALLVAGCGDGGGDSTQTKAPVASAPAANEPLADAATRLERTVPGRDCRALGRLILHSARRAAEPDTPPTTSECNQLRLLKRGDLAGFRARRSVRFGAGGFTEGSADAPRPGEVEGVVWALDRDGSWKAVYDAVFRRQIGLPPEYRKTADLNAARFVRAVADADCDGMWRLLNLGSRFVDGNHGDERVLCRAILPQYADPKSAFAQIKADPKAAPRRLGATRDIAFYGLELRNGRYMLIVLAGRLGGRFDIRQQKQHDNPSVLEFLTVRRPAG
jgi:hypothetical protein